MFDDLPSAGSSKKMNSDEAFGLLKELGKNTPDEIRRQRTHFRVEIKSALTLQPGNASDLLKFKMQGTTGDVSEGGLSALFPMPVHVGDIYRLIFDRSKLDLPLTYARCLRCRVLRDGAFEVGFCFFAPILLPENAHNGVESDLSS